MQWLKQLVDEIVARKPTGEIVISSGASPSGTYHFGHLREIITADGIVRELLKRGRLAQHLHVVDDLDALRKVPTNAPSDYEKYLGQALCDIPAPDGSRRSYADYFVDDFLEAAKKLGIDVQTIRAHERYRQGFFTAAIEKALQNTQAIRQILEAVSGHKLDNTWSPIQIMEEGYLKKRQFVSLDTSAKTLVYLDKDGRQQTTGYKKGEVKLDWRIDWPARWWLQKVDVEPYGRDHATKGGSYDTGTDIVRKIFAGEPPHPVPYDFVNRVGDSKKMSASLGTGIAVAEVTQVLPAEVVRYFMLRYPPSKRLYFDEQNLARLIDEYAEAISSGGDPQLIEMSQAGQEHMVARVPFTHLVASYQAALKDPQKTIDVLRRVEHGNIIEQDADIIKKELAFIDRWLQKWAPDEVKFELLPGVNRSEFSVEEIAFLNKLSQKITQAPPNASGEWFHKAIYELKEADGLSAEQVFKPLYRALIGQDSGPRAGWFLSILPRDWLIRRLKLEA